MRLNCISNTKVNIGLAFLGQREDGYHNISTIFQELSFGDSIHIEKINLGCQIFTNVDWVPSDESNTCFKAYKELKKKFPNCGGVSIQLNKKVPIGSGLGGGSANAAAVLKGINKLYNLGASIKQLEEIGFKIGADVPFFIKGKTQHGEGIGNVLTPISNTVKGSYLLIIPDISISTEWAYSSIKNQLNYEDNSAKFSSFLSGEYSSLKIFENDFERIVIPAYPEIGAIKKNLLKFGARFASLSGSGSTVYGIFDEEASIKEAELFFRHSHQTILAMPT